MDDVVAGFGLIIDGAVVPGAAGTYPVTNPARPGEVVLHAPAASADQLDQAVAAARAAQGPWAQLATKERAALVIVAAESAGRAVEADGLASLLTREHGKVLWEAMFDAGTLGAMAGAFAPVAESANAACATSSGTKRTEVRRMPHGVVAALLPFNWPVAVMGDKVAPALFDRQHGRREVPTHVSGGGAALRGGDGGVAAARGAQRGERPPRGVGGRAGGPSGGGHGLVHRRCGDGAGRDGGRGRLDQAGGPRAGGERPRGAAADVAVDAALADRIVGATFVTSGQVCMAIKRLYVPEARVDEVVDALSARLAAEVVGDGLDEGVTMGPVHLADAAARVEAMLEEAEHLGSKVLRPERVRDR